MHDLFLSHPQAGVRIHELPRSACIAIEAPPLSRKTTPFLCTDSQQSTQVQERHGGWREKAMTLFRSRGDAEDTFSESKLRSRGCPSGRVVCRGRRRAIRLSRGCPSGIPSGVSGTTNVLRVVVTSSYKAEAGRGGCPSARHGHCNFKLSTKLKREARIDRLQCDKSAKAAI